MIFLQILLILVKHLMFVSPPQYPSIQMIFCQNKFSFQLSGYFINENILANIVDTRKASYHCKYCWYLWSILCLYPPLNIPYLYTNGPLPPLQPCMGQHLHFEWNRQKLKEKKKWETLLVTKYFQRELAPILNWN